MHFLLFSMSVVYVLTTPIPKDGGDDATVEQIRKRPKMLNLPKNYEIPLRPNIWTRMHQVRSYLFTQHKMNMEEAIQVSCIIDKLPLWKDSKHTLKHLKEELTLVELDNHLRIKESPSMQDSDKLKGNNVVGPSVVNMVEHNNSSRNNDNKGKRKHHNNTKADPNKKSKVTCWKCGKPGHLKKDYKGGKVGNKANGSGTNGSVDGSTNLLKGQNMFNNSFRVYYVTYVFEAYFVQDDDFAWWVDSGETIHACKDRCWFKTYESLNDGSIFTWEMSQQVWGYREVVRLSDPKLKTLGKRGIRCIFVGCDEHSKAFRFYVIEPNDSVLINSIIESKDAICDENRFSSIPRPSLRIPNKTKDIGGSVVPKKVTEEDVTFWKEAINDEIDSIMGNNTWVLVDLPPVQVDLTKEFLSSRFSMKDMREDDVILVSTNMDTSENLMPNNGQAVFQLEYFRVIRCLMYVMTCTRHDIAFAVGKLSRYTSNPVLKGYTDASWINNTEDNSSTSGWVFLLGGAAGKEADWLKNLLLEISLWSKPIAPISIRCDSAATLARAYSQMYNEKSRHLGVRHSMIRKLIKNEVISIEFVRSQ
nr:hypothetical protein [Tanacetum cinerariifolium]